MEAGYVIMDSAQIIESCAQVGHVTTDNYLSCGISETPLYKDNMRTYAGESLWDATLREYAFPLDINQEENDDEDHRTGMLYLETEKELFIIALVGESYSSLYYPLSDFEDYRYFSAHRAAKKLFNTMEFVPSTTLNEEEVKLLKRVHKITFPKNHTFSRLASPFDNVPKVKPHAGFSYQWSWIVSQHHYHKCTSQEFYYFKQIRTKLLYEAIIKEGVKEDLSTATEMTKHNYFEEG